MLQFDGLMSLVVWRCNDLSRACLKLAGQRLDGGYLPAALRPFHKSYWLNVMI